MQLHLQKCTGCISEGIQTSLKDNERPRLSIRTALGSRRFYESVCSDRWIPGMYWVLLSTCSAPGIVCMDKKLLRSAALSADWSEGCHASCKRRSLRDVMMWPSCWGASSLSRLAYASCAAAASLKQLLVTQKLYRTCKYSWAEGRHNLTVTITHALSSSHCSQICKLGGSVEKGCRCCQHVNKGMQQTTW